MLHIKLAIAFTLGNFIFQAFTKRDWATALERSFLQGAALLVAGYCASK